MVMVAERAGCRRAGPGHGAGPGGPAGLVAGPVRRLPRAAPRPVRDGRPSGATGGQHQHQTGLQQRRGRRDRHRHRSQRCRADQQPRDRGR
ncbi:serine protease pepA, partial [Mycobacterium tuberculosis T46]